MSQVNARDCLIANLDLANDRPQNHPYIGEVVNAQVRGKPMVYISIEHQGTFRLEGRQAEALAWALQVVGIEPSCTPTY